MAKTRKQLRIELDHLTQRLASVDGRSKSQLRTSLAQAEKMVMDNAQALDEAKKELAALRETLHQKDGQIAVLQKAASASVEA